MLCIALASTDPYFNIASEEYLLKNFQEDIFMLYRNRPSVIVGKHQNTFGEINYKFVKNNNIKVVRRLSGGGTVFHDDGNLNFCFIKNGQEGNLIDFKKFTQPIISVLQSLGVPAEHSGRNDIIINGLKFSGNAEHVYKNRVLHHGTLLFSSKLDSLREALKVKPEAYQDKAVKSVRSRVTNIVEHLPKPMQIEDFQDIIIKHVISQTGHASFYSFSETDLTAIQILMEEKYCTWDWNFGYSPKFVFTNKGIIENQTIEAMLEIEKGTIKKAEIFLDNKLIPEFSEYLLNISYKEEAIKEAVTGYTAINGDALLEILF